MSKRGNESSSTADTVERLRAVADAAKSGDASVLPRLRELLDQNPVCWQQYGDVARLAERGWVNLLAGSNLYLRESVLRMLAAKRAELTRASASPLEKLLVDWVVATWLEVHYFDMVEGQSRDADKLPLALKYMSDRKALAGRELERAVTVLARHQKLFPITRRSSPAPEDARTATAHAPEPSESTAAPHGRSTETVTEAEPRATENPGRRRDEIVTAPTGEANGTAVHANETAGHANGTTGHQTLTTGAEFPPGRPDAGTANTAAPGGNGTGGTALPAIAPGDPRSRSGGGRRRTPVSPPTPTPTPAPEPVPVVAGGDGTTSRARQPRRSRRKTALPKALQNRLNGSLSPDAAQAAYRILRGTEEPHRDHDRPAGDEDD